MRLCALDGCNRAVQNPHANAKFCPDHAVVRHGRTKLRLEQFPCELCSTLSRKRHAARTFHLCDDCRLRWIPMLAIWRKHAVPANQCYEWIRNPVCWVCNDAIDLRTETTAVDHDHSHCSGQTGCTRCLRGLTHAVCNRRIGTVDALLNQLGPVRLGIVVTTLIHSKTIVSKAS